MRIKSDHAGVSPALQELKKNETETVKPKTVTAEPEAAEAQDAVAVDTETEAPEVPQTYNAKGVAAEGKVPRGLLVALRNHLAKEGSELPPGLAKKVQRLGVVDGDSDGALTVAEIEGFAAARGIKLPALNSAPVVAPVEPPADGTDPATEVPVEGDPAVTPEIPPVGTGPVTLPGVENPVVADPVTVPVVEDPAVADPVAVPGTETPVIDPVTVPGLEIPVIDPIAEPVTAAPADPLAIVIDPATEVPAEAIVAEPSVIPDAAAVPTSTSLDQLLVDQLAPGDQETV